MKVSLPQSGDYILPFHPSLSHSHWAVLCASDYLSMMLKNTLWIRFCQLSRWEAMKKETSWPGPDYFPYKSFCSCHYLDVAPVFYSVNFLERLSRAAKDILLCQMFRLLLSLCPGTHLSFFGSIAAMLALMPASVPGMFKETLLKQKGWIQRECE